MSDNHFHEVAVTAIIVKDGKFFIARRSMQEKRFPGMWTVPGGKLEVSDYDKWDKTIGDFWYQVVEKVLAKEVKEETGMDIKNVNYVTSLVTIHKDTPLLIMSFMADYDGGEVVLQEEELDQYAWVSLEEAKGYQLIDGIYEELIIADEKNKKNKN